MKVFLPAAGFFAFIAVLFSALGAHHYKEIMPAANYYDFFLAIKYQLFHSIALMALGLFGFVTKKPFRLLVLAGYLMIVGIIFFCGDIYLMTMVHAKETQALTPIGGTAFLLAWAVIFVAGVYYYFRSVHAHDM